MQIWLSALAISFITATLKKDFDSALLDDKLWVSQKKKDKENQDTLYTAAQLKAYFRRSIISFLTVIQSLIFVDSGSINCKMMAKFQRTKCLVIPFVSVLEWSKILQFLRLALYRSSRPGVFCKKSAVKNFTKFTVKHPCQSLFIKKETLAQVFYCEFCGISQNTFFYRTPLVAASVFILEFHGSFI